MHVVGVADLDGAGEDQLNSASWPADAQRRRSLADAHARRTTFVTDDAMALIAIRASR